MFSQSPGTTFYYILSPIIRHVVGLIADDILYVFE